MLAFLLPACSTGARTRLNWQRSICQCPAGQGVTSHTCPTSRVLRIITLSTLRLCSTARIRRAFPYHSSRLAHHIVGSLSSVARRAHIGVRPIVEPSCQHGRRSTPTNQQFCGVQARVGQPHGTSCCIGMKKYCSMLNWQVFWPAYCLRNADQGCCCSYRLLLTDVVSVATPSLRTMIGSYDLFCAQQIVSAGSIPPFVRLSEVVCVKL